MFSSSRRGLLCGAAAAALFCGARKSFAAPGFFFLASPRPPLNLNFTIQVYTDDPAQVLSCSRNLTAYSNTSTGALVAFAPNVPRITDLGLFVEASATNLTLQSVDMSNAQWTKTNTVAAANAGTAPDGSATANSIADNSTSAGHTVVNSTTTNVTNGSVYVGSVYAKSGTNNRIQLTFSNSNSTFTGVGFANFNLTSGTVVLTGGTLVASGITALPNGWYRCWISATATATAATTGITVVCINADAATRAVAYAGTGTTILTWLPQMELRNTAMVMPSSPIPTTTATVARPIDAITIIGRLATMMNTVAFNIAIGTNSAFAAATNQPTLIGAGAAVVRVLGVNASTQLTSNWAASIGDSTSHTWTSAQTSSFAANLSGAALTVSTTKPYVLASTATAAVAAAQYSLGSSGNGANALNGYITSLVAFAIDSTQPPDTTFYFNSTTFSDNFTSLSEVDLADTANAGFNWYLRNAWPNSLLNSYKTLPSSDPTGVVLNGSGNGFQLSKGSHFNLASACTDGANGFHGRTFSGGGYFECSMNYDPTQALTSDIIWPAFWSLGVAHLEGLGGAVYDELDFYEAFPISNGATEANYGAHEWTITGGGSSLTSNSLAFTNVTLPGSPVLTNFHRYGTLWVPPSKNGGTGLIQRYFDGQLLSTTTFNYGAGGALPAFTPSNPNGVFTANDTDSIVLLLSAGPGSGWPVNVNNVRVIQ